MSSIRCGRAFHVGLYYHVLSFLDLGRDAANLFIPRGFTRPWVAPLNRLWIDSPSAASTLQHLPLGLEDFDAVLEELGRRGDPLALELLTTLLDELEPFGVSFSPAVPVVAPLIRHLAPLRAGLYARSGESPVDLLVLDTPALGPNGRGLSSKTRHIVATSLEQPLEHVICQVFHEEVHAISDREVTIVGARCTQVGTPGFAVHHALERHAVEVGSQLIHAHAPALMPAYERWKQRYGV